MKYSGIDLYSNNSVVTVTVTVTVTDEQDRIVAEKRLPNNLTGDFADRNDFGARAPRCA